jgi:hypothetical protein
MSFLHPWAIAVGAFAVALPLAIHWLTKPRPRRMPLSTVRFVRQVIAQRRARYRLRDLLVLLLRAAAVLLLGWAFARPLTGATPLVSPGAPGDAVRVVLLDASLSMGAVADGQTAFDRARAAAARFVQYSPGLRGDLLLAAARPGAVFDAASSNFPALAQALATAAPRPERLDVQAAINKAADVLARAPRSPGGRLELVILSDFQRTSWARADFSPVPKDAAIQFESVAPARAPENLAVLRAAAVGRVEQGREARIEVDVGNYARTARAVRVDVSVGDGACQLAGVCPPGVRTTLGGTVTLRRAGWVAGTAKLVGVTDALPTDDARPFVVDVRPPPTYALITRESAKPHASSSHFLQLALVPGRPTGDGPGEKVVRVDPDRPDRDALATAGLLVLDHPGPLPADVVNLLAGMVRRGRGMLYVAAEPADATNLRRLADAAGSDLKLPVDFQPPPANAPRDGLFLLDWKRDAPPFAAIAETMTAVAPALRFGGGLSTRRAEGGLQDDVLATYGDRSAALVVTACGAGTIAVLNGDLTESNLPSSPVFVPLVGELVGRLMAGGTSPDAAPCGEPLAAYLPPEAASVTGLSVVGADGAKLPGSALSQEGSFVLWRSDAAGPPGVYSVRRGDQAVFAIATAAPASESDLEPLDPGVLKTRLAAGRSVSFEGANDQPPKDQAWTWILIGCCCCMLAEFGILRAFGSPS